MENLSTKKLIELFENIRDEMIDDIENTDFLSVRRESVLKHQPLLDDILKIEEALLSTDGGFVNIRFMYCNISRLALHTHDFERAVSYALAGIELNSLAEDKEGELLNMDNIVVIMLYLSAHKSLAKYLRSNPELVSRISLSLEDIDGRSSENDDLITFLLNSSKRPKSMALAIKRTLESGNHDRAISAKEAALVIKKCASTMGVTPNTVLRNALS
ncbi:hypothetical protein [Pseudoalteromonas sp. G4]|uniref:hypothetical protein n=1 Tax=Pseudoalteromonas sp. G4 TaxID=2992761 RepID=UPI00237E8CBA|nr:hypothetical protein [Pseudoalteromonas sp. G4]MDE3272459.1 hypothetical protein [Pseudoalteromonas sp. G4]